MLFGIAVLAAIPDRLGSVFRRDDRTGLRKLVWWLAGLAQLAANSSLNDNKGYSVPIS
jgi:hypothetical protein